MSCTTRFLNTEWQHHAWRRHVTDEETLPGQVTNMWGRRVDVDRVRCHTVEVCDECGAVRDTGDCLCDPAEANGCAIRLEHLGRART